MFLGYSNSHKGFKCLDPSEGRVYISRDIVFDETVFLFAHLHPNAGAQLRAAIALLPPSLLPASSTFGDAILLDQGSLDSVPTNPPSSSRACPVSTEKNSTAFDDAMAAQTAGEQVLPHPYFMCPPGGDGAPAKADPPDGADSPVGGSNSGSAPASSAPRLSSTSVSTSGSSAGDPSVSPPPNPVDSGAAAHWDPPAGGLVRLLLS